MATAKTRARKPAPAPPLSEAAFQQQVTDYATLCGWRWTHTPDSRRVQGTPGFPDLVLARGFTLIFAELKTERGRVRPEQTNWINALRWAHGKHVYIWRPSDWHEIERILR